jgi:hypothetical protein
MLLLCGFKIPWTFRKSGACVPFAMVRSHDSIASTGTRSEVEMKYVDLVPGDHVGGQMYQFNARIGNLPLPFFFYCTEYVCIKK